MKSQLYYKDILDPELNKLEIRRADAPTNKWLYEVWDMYKGDKHVYHKPRTIENCWIKYGHVVKSIGYLHINTDDRFKMLISPDGTQNNEHMVPDLESYEGLENIRFFKRNFPNNEQSIKLFSKIKEFYNDYKPTRGDDFHSLFGEPNDFSQHWNWSGALQQLWNNTTGWVFHIGSDSFNISALSELTGTHLGTSQMNCSAMLSNTNITEVTFKFHNLAIVSCDNMFSSVRTGAWGVFNIRTEHDEWPRYGIERQGDKIVKISGWWPRAIIKMFRSAQPSQAALDEVMKHTNWSQCFDFTGAFQSGLRCQHSYIHQNKDCAPFEEHEANTWRPNKYEASDNFFGLVYHNGIHQFSAGLVDTFNDSSIDEVRCIIDFDYLFSDGYCAFKNFLRADRNIRWGQGLNAESVKPMKKIRIKNLGNDPVYDFAGGHDQGCDAHYFDEESIKYLIDHLKDLNPYSDDQAVRNRTRVMQPRSKLYVPEQWRPHITPEQLREMTRKQWECYIGTELLNPAATTVSATYDANRGTVSE